MTEILSDDFNTIFVRLALAVLAGGLIGFERAFHGRPAGFRTHSLVCAASSLLMLLTVFQWDLLANVPQETIRVDPTRMAQGIMTGIGFLGAGVIMQEKLTIRGLTTAAAIWITASIGIIIGMGMYSAAALATVFTLLILSVFGWVERRLPTQRYAHMSITTPADSGLDRDEIMTAVLAHNIKCAAPSYHMEDMGQTMRYEFTLRSINSGNFEVLAETLKNNGKITEFSLIPSGEQRVRISTTG